jgi:Glycosyl hydrolase family 26
MSRLTDGLRRKTLIPTLRGRGTHRLRGEAATTPGTAAARSGPLRIPALLLRLLAAAVPVLLASGCTLGVSPQHGPQAGTVAPQAAVTASTDGSSRCGVNGNLVPRCPGALWGAYAASAAGQDWVTPFTNLERSMGRPFDVVKRYHDWSGAGDNGRFPDAAERRLGSGKHPRILYFAWSSDLYEAHSQAVWSDIAAGKYDASVIRPEAERIRRWGRPVFLDFDHEMDDSSRRSKGTSAQYVQAYRHIHQIFTSMHVTNVRWVWVSTGWVPNHQRIAASYPGDAYVDWIGYDPYNFFTCNGSAWHTPRQTVEPFYRWLVRNGHGNKPFMLAEYGSISGPTPASEPSWYHQFVRTLPRFPKIRAVLQFDAATSPSCRFGVERPAAVRLGFAQASRFPYVHVR